MLLLLPLPLPTPPHSPPFSIPRNPRRPLPPRQKAIFGIIRPHLRRFSTPLRHPSNIPISLPPLIPRPQSQLRLHRLPIPYILHDSRLTIGLRYFALDGGEIAGIVFDGGHGREGREVGHVACDLLCFGFGHAVGEHAEHAATGGVVGLGEDVVALEDYADVFALGVGGVAVVFHVAGDLGVDGVVAALYVVC